jgi:hypothetical protein
MRAFGAGRSSTARPARFERRAPCSLHFGEVQAGNSRSKADHSHSKSDGLRKSWLSGVTGVRIIQAVRDSGGEVVKAAETDFAHGRSETARCILHLPVDFALVDSEPNLNQIASTLFLFCSRWC